MTKPFLIVLGCFAAALAGVTFLLRDPQFGNLRQLAASYSQSDRLREAESCYLAIVRSDTAGIEDHYIYINTHYSLPQREKTGRYTSRVRDDRTIKQFYETMSRESDSLRHDAGCYGLGLCASHENDYRLALNCFVHVYNRQQKYLNNSIGFIYRATHDFAAGEPYFEAEIRAHGNMAGAYSNLIDGYLAEKKFPALNRLLADTSTRRYFSFENERLVRFEQGNMGGYFTTIFSRFAGRVNSFGFIGALLILLCWLFFLRQIDVFEKEKWNYLIATCLLGMLFSFGTYFISDAIHEWFHFELNGGILNDFFYCVIGIGAVEELVKFLPLLIMLAFTTEINEPIDYIIYASVSALGFAFVENLLYLDQGRLFILHGRALAAAISHMIDASIIAYGLIIARYKNKTNVYAAFFLSYLLAALVHGFYDFWLINERVSEFGILTMLLMVYTFGFYSVFIANALNNSSFFDEAKIMDAHKLKDYLVYALSSVIMLEYLMMALKFGPTAGNQTLLKSALSGAYLIILLSTDLSRYHIKQGEWKPVFASVFRRRRRWAKEDE